MTIAHRRTRIFTWWRSGRWRFSPEELEACIHEQLNEGANVCEPSGRTEEIVSVLAKAEYVKALMGKGATLPEVMRELGRRIRAVQQQGGAA